MRPNPAPLPWVPVPGLLVATVVSIKICSSRPHVVVFAQIRWPVADIHGARPYLPRRHDHSGESVTQSLGECNAGGGSVLTPRPPSRAGKGEIIYSDSTAKPPCPVWAGGKGG